MRSLFAAGFVLALVVLPGCGSGNAAKVEQVNAQLLAEMMKIADGMESGDKEGIKAAMARYRSLRNDNKNLKVTVSQKKKIDEKMNADKEKIRKRFTEVGMKAATSGKFSPAELQQLISDITALDN